jgi:hypothetical protein
LLLLDSVLMWAGFRYVLAGGDGLILTAYAAEILLALMVLIQDRDHPLRIAYLLSAVALVCVGFDAYSTVPDIGRRILMQALPPDQAALITANTQFSNRVQLFALVWRLAAGLAGVATLLLTRVPKPVPSPEPPPAQEVPPQ